MLSNGGGHHPSARTWGSCCRSASSWLLPSYLGHECCPSGGGMPAPPAVGCRNPFCGEGICDRGVAASGLAFALNSAANLRIHCVGPPESHSLTPLLRECVSSPLSPKAA